MRCFILWKASPVPIVTVSRELGSLGTQVAATLCERLGYARLDKESLEALLRNYGMSRHQFERDDEKEPGFWERCRSGRLRYLDFMKMAMYRFAVERDCVILGRGAHIIFRDVPGTLRLRFIASLGVRAARLCERFGIDEARALCLIRDNDRERAGYHRYFFDASVDAPTEYDLLINTSDMSLGDICDTVLTLLRSPTYARAQERTRETLRDLCIAQGVTVDLLYRDRAPVVSLSVQCAKGVVTLNGTARSAAAIDQCTAVARSAKGVSGVCCNLKVQEYPVSMDWRL